MHAVTVRGPLAAIVAALIATGCDSTPAPTAPSPQTVPIQFTLASEIPPAPTDPMQAAMAQYCVRNMLGRSSLTFGFSEQWYYLDERSPGMAEVRVPAVPVGQTHVVVVRSIHACTADPLGTGIATEGLAANGVPLRTVTTFPFTDMPALQFRVASDGRVLP